MSAADRAALPPPITNTSSLLFFEFIDMVESMKHWLYIDK